jgi:hypothetical protein
LQKDPADVVVLDKKLEVISVVLPSRRASRDDEKLSHFLLDTHFREGLMGPKARDKGRKNKGNKHGGLAF